MTIDGRLVGKGLTPHTAHRASHILAGHPEARVSSGRRTSYRNRQVGGVPGSLHLNGRAVDITGPRHVLLHMRDAAVDDGAIEVLLEYMGTRRQHLHLAW